VPEACGDEEVFLAGKGTITFIQGEDFFMDGATCRYKIMFPKAAKHYDKVEISVKKLKNAKIFVTESMRYSAK